MTNLNAADEGRAYPKKVYLAVDKTTDPKELADRLIAALFGDDEENPPAVSPKGH